jgi:hypothetical protein
MATAVRRNGTLEGRLEMSTAADSTVLILFSR